MEKLHLETRSKSFGAYVRSLVAPLALTAFKGSAESPEVLCSINLDGQAGAREENTVMLGSTETAEYAGSTSGSKDSWTFMVIEAAGSRQKAFVRHGD